MATSTLYKDTTRFPNVSDQPVQDNMTIRNYKVHVSQQLSITSLDSRQIMSEKSFTINTHTRNVKFLPNINRSKTSLPDNRPQMPSWQNQVSSGASGDKIRLQEGDRKGPILMRASSDNDILNDELYRIDNSYLQELNSIRRTLNLVELSERKPSGCDVPQQHNEPEIREKPDKQVSAKDNQTSWDQQSGSSNFSYNPPKKKLRIREETPRTSSVEKIYNNLKNEQLAKFTKKQKHRTSSEDFTKKYSSHSSIKSIPVKHFDAGCPEDCIFFHRGASGNGPDLNLYYTSKDNTPRMLYDNSPNVQKSSTTYSKSTTCSSGGGDCPDINDKEPSENPVENQSANGRLSPLFHYLNTPDDLDSDRSSAVKPHITTITNDDPKKSLRSTPRSIPKNKVEPLEATVYSVRNTESTAKESKSSDSCKIDPESKMLTSGLDLPRKSLIACTFPSIVHITQSMVKQESIKDFFVNMTQTNRSSRGFSAEFEPKKTNRGFNRFRDIAQELLTSPTLLRKDLDLHDSVPEVDTTADLSTDDEGRQFHDSTRSSNEETTRRTRCSWTDDCVLFWCCRRMKK